MRLPPPPPPPHRTGFYSVFIAVCMKYTQKPIKGQKRGIGITDKPAKAYKKLSVAKKAIQ